MKNGPFFPLAVVWDIYCLSVSFSRQGEDPSSFGGRESFERESPLAYSFFSVAPFSFCCCYGRFLFLWAASFFPSISQRKKMVTAVIFLYRGAHPSGRFGPRFHMSLLVLVTLSNSFLSSNRINGPCFLPILFVEWPLCTHAVSCCAGHDVKGRRKWPFYLYNSRACFFFYGLLLFVPVPIDFDG